MAEDEAAEHERMRRFRDAALPYLDDVFTLARYLVRNPADAEDAAQECYVRALRHFDSYRGPAMKPWLLAILRNVCNDEFARRRDREIPTDYAEDETRGGSDAGMAGGASLAGRSDVKGARRRHHSPSGRGAARAVSRIRSYCARSTIFLIRRSPRFPVCR